jgi:hypothetical protein
MLNCDKYELDEHIKSPKLCPKTGAHFKFDDMCARLRGLARSRQKRDGVYMVIRNTAQTNKAALSIVNPAKQLDH